MTFRNFAFAAALWLAPVSAPESQSLFSDADWNDLRHGLPGKTTATNVRGAGSPPHRKPFALRESAETVRRYACAMSVPPDLALAIAEQESNFIPAVGADGELGIMQVMAGTADQYLLDRSLLMDAQYGTYAGLTILSELLKAFPDTKEAIAAYNAGSGFRQRQLPADVIQKIDGYVAQVLDRRKKYHAARC